MNIIFKPKENKTYILAFGPCRRSDNKKILCTIKFNSDGTIKETTYQFMKIIAEWIINSGECGSPGHIDQFKYLLIEAENN